MIRYTFRRRSSPTTPNNRRVAIFKEAAIPISAPATLRKWECHKLESFAEFIDSYSATTRKAAFSYLELFTGRGSTLCNGADCYLEGTAIRALKSKAKFFRYGFLTPSRENASELRKQIEQFENAAKAEVLTGNPAKEKTLVHLLDNVPRSALALVYVDPHGYRRLEYSTLEKLAKFGKNWQNQKVDLLIIFPLEMALLRHLTQPECAESLTRFYGNHSWEDIRRQIQMRKANREDIKYKLVELYKDGLHNLGYRYVEDFKPASPTHEPYYQVIYAGDSQSRKAALKEAWGRPRFLRCELLYGVKTK